jgi:PIN domain
MAFEPPIVVYDACVLYPFHTRNLLTQCAVDRLIEARWTDAIHAEWIRNLAASSPSLPIERLHKIRDLMNRALPGADVRGYEPHIAGLALPDPDDRHVLAAAITADASRIVTWNLRDFPDEALSGHGLRAQTPDGLLMHLYDHIPEAVVASTARARRNLRRSLTLPVAFLDALSRQGLGRFASQMRGHLADL